MSYSLCTSVPGAGGSDIVVGQTVDGEVVDGGGAACGLGFGVLGVLRTVVFGGLRLLVSGCSARVRPRWGCGIPVPSGVAYDYRSVRSTRQHL